MKPLFFILAIFSTQAASADNCDNPRDEFDGLYCLNKIYMKSNEELNSSFKELRALLNTDEKKSLLKTQLQWIDDDDNNKGIFTVQPIQIIKSISPTNILLMDRHLPATA